MNAGRRKRLTTRIAVAMALLYLPPGVALAGCSVNVTSVAFGPYDAKGTSGTPGTGTVSVTCTEAGSYRISLGPGMGTRQQRLMTSGAHQLAYNLFTDANYTVIWGDGTGGTATISGQVSADATASSPVAGLIPSGQNPWVGEYTDEVSVTVDF